MEKKQCQYEWVKINLQDFIRRLKSKNHLVQHNKKHHRKVLLSYFHLNGHTLGFQSASKARTTLYSIINSTIGKYCSIAFI